MLLVILSLGLLLTTYAHGWWNQATNTMFFLSNSVLFGSVFFTFSGLKKVLLPLRHVLSLVCTQLLVVVEPGHKKIILMHLPIQSLIVYILISIWKLGYYLLRRMKRWIHTWKHELNFSENHLSAPYQPSPQCLPPRLSSFIHLWKKPLRCTTTYLVCFLMKGTNILLERWAAKTGLIPCE